MADKYYVAKGKAISCKRGIVGEGEVICKDDLATPENFDLLVKSDKKLLTKTKPDLPAKGVNEMPLRKESKQEVELSEDPKKSKKSKSEDEKSEDNSDEKSEDEKSGPDAGAKKK